MKKSAYFASVTAALLMGTALAGCSYTGAPIHERQVGNSTAEDNRARDRAAAAEAESKGEDGAATE